MSDQQITTKGRFQEVSFRVFALVGFLSSIVTIIAWATGTNVSLQAVITEKTIEVPEALQLSKLTTDDYTLAESLSNISDRYCSQVNIDYDGSKNKNYYYNANTCQRQKALHEVLKQISALDGKPLLAYDLALINDGSQVAENIRIRSPVDVDVTASDEDGGTVKISTVQEKRTFTVPDLNPRETLNVRLVSSTPPPAPYETANTKPTVTFSGGKASHQTYIYISGRYSGIVRFLDDMPLILQIIAIAVGAFMITIIWLLPVSLVASASEARKKAASTPALTTQAT